MSYLQLDGAATRQGFEAALVMCGNIVNEDVSLSHVHMTPGAGGVSVTDLEILLTIFNTLCSSVRGAAKPVTMSALGT